VDTSLFLLILSISLPKKRIIRPIGVTTIKNTIPTTIGNTIEPKKIQNLYQSLFNGVKNLEFKIPKSKKIKDKIRPTILNLLEILISFLSVYAIELIHSNHS